MDLNDSKYIAAWRKHFTEQDAESRALATRARKDLAQAVKILSLIKRQEQT